MGAQKPGVAEQIAAAQAALEALRERTRTLSVELAKRVHGTVERTGQLVERVQAVVETPAKLRAYIDDNKGAFELIGLGLLAGVAGLFAALGQPKRAPRQPRLAGRVRLLLGDGMRGGLRVARRRRSGGLLVALACGLAAAVVAEQLLAARRRR